jgi:hypothetical protein
MLAVILAGIAIASASAQTAGWRFRWQSGQVLTYRIEHATTVAETLNGSKIETASQVKLTKRWEVAAVDANGVATLRLSLTAMRHEQTRPNGEVLLFDSENPDKSTPELREQMGKYLGQVLAVLRVDGQGRVLEVKQGDAGRFETDPPFGVILPLPMPKEGNIWERDYNISLDPPQGTGEKYPAAQRYRCNKIDGTRATFGVTTQIKKMPDSALDRVPLLQRQPQGEIIFDFQTGRVLSSRLTIDKEVQGYQGEGSSYRFQSQFTEQLVESN